MTRRTIIFSFLALAFLAGCGRPGPTSEKGGADVGQPVQGDWVIVRTETDPDNLNPLISQQATARYVMGGVNNSQIYEFLMGYSTKDWDLTEPLLAEAPPDISADHLTYTFKIRDGVKWHDGKPFTADDVLFTFKAVACPLTDTAPLRGKGTARRSAITIATPRTRTPQPSET